MEDIVLNELCTAGKNKYMSHLTATMIIMDLFSFWLVRVLHLIQSDNLNLFTPSVNQMSMLRKQPAAEKMSSFYFPILDILLVLFKRKSLPRFYVGGRW